MATVQGSGTAMKLCPFPDYILNGEIPTIPGLTDFMTASVSSSATTPVDDKNIPYHLSSITPSKGSIMGSFVLSVRGRSFVERGIKCMFRC